MEVVKETSDRTWNDVPMIKCLKVQLALPKVCSQIGSPNPKESMTGSMAWRMVRPRRRLWLLGNNMTTPTSKNLHTCSNAISRALNQKRRYRIQKEKTKSL